MLLCFIDDSTIRNTLCPNKMVDIIANEWMAEYVDRFSCQSPMDKSKWLSFTKKNELYKEYLHRFTNQDTLTRDQFYEMWRVRFPDIVLKKFKKIFGKCWECYFIAEAMQNANSDKELSCATKLLHMHRGGMYMPGRAWYAL